MNDNDNVITWTESAGLVTLTFDDPAQSVNTMRAAYLSSMDKVLEKLQTLNGLTGIVLASAKKSFFAGGDLNELLAAQPEDAPELTAFTTRAKAQLRALETLGVPVVAALEGSALGGGYELALAAHHRIVADDPRIKIGLPEVTLGLLPGGGGVVRTVRLIGLDSALDNVLLTGKSYGPSAARGLGLVDDIVPVGDVIAAAQKWISNNPEAKQPWDAGAPIPGGTAYDPAVEATLALRTAALRARHKGAPMPAPAAILSSAVESTQVDIDSAFAIETRYFVDLATSPIAKNIIQGVFFDRQSIASGASRPKEFPTHRAERLGVIGAGLMGAGIALSAATSGIEVLLKDVDAAAAERGKAYAEKVLTKQVARGSMSEEGAAEVLARITAVTDPADFAGVDLVIEAVFEDPDLKAKVIGEVLGFVAPDAVIASNTSTLPIGQLAATVDRPADFIGLHFFSPAERMELVEIIVGEHTSDATLAKAFDIVRQLRKTPIVVGDGRGFFTSRVILTRLLEAAAMVGEGISPSSIEQASRQAGYPLGTLALSDETSLALPHKIYGQFRAEAQRVGADFHDHPGDTVLTRLVDALGRTGRAAGAGYYEYVDGRRTGVWPGLEDEFGPSSPASDLDEIKDRLLFAEALDTARCLESGLLRSTADANVGSMLGIGFPTWTGGAAQFVTGYPGGVSAFVARAQQLAESHGPRFLPPESLVRQADTAESKREATYA